MLKLSFITFLLSLGSFVFCQTIIDTSGKRSRFPLLVKSFDNDFGLKPISKSKNPVEIRLYKSGLSLTIYGSVLSYDGKHWIFKSYKQKVPNSATIISNEDSTFKKIYDSLLSWKAFDIPSMYKLKVNGQIDDGSDYIFMFKIDKKLGNIDFSNPCSYLIINRESREIQVYCKIVDAFTKDW